MIANAQSYDYVTVSTPSCVSGRDFAATVPPRLEELLWLDEAMLTAECRGGFTPLTGRYPSIGNRPDPATVTVMDRSYADLKRRFNAVLTTPYHVWSNLPSGVWSSLSSSISGNAQQGLPPAFYLPSTAIASSASTALTTPAGVTFSDSVCPKPNTSAWTTAVRRGCSDLSLVRSAIWNTTNHNGLDNALDVTGRALRRNGAVGGNTPLQDWSSGLGLPNPLFDEQVGGDDDPRTRGVIDYYRVKTDTQDITYSQEGDWSLPIYNPPWTHLTLSRQTTVYVMIVWACYCSAVWSRTLNGGYESVRDYTVNRRIWSGPTSASWFGGVGTRDGTSLNWQFASGPTSSALRDIGDHVCSVIDPAGLPSTGPTGGGSGFSKVGYMALVECVGAIYVATTATRNLGT